jgi:magnesium transporter
MIEELGKVFNIHYMILEDITNIHQRPSIDTYDNIVSLQLKNICFNDKSLASELEHISIVRTDTAILSFQENKTDTFESIQNRIERQAGRIRCMNKNYLFYVLLDLIVDNYFKAIDLISDKIDMIEEEVFEDKNSVNTQEMHILKKSVLSFKRNIMPVRDIVNRIIRNDDKVFDKNLMIYFRDLYSHIINVIESVESYRDILSGLKDLYISNNSNRINEIMKTLTVVSTIFIPLGFLTGVFGMNFVEMHELNSKIAYPIGFWSVSLIIAIIMLIYFKRKKWF